MRAHQIVNAAIATDARKALAEVFEELGGAEGLAEWARANKKLFYLFLWPRLLPKQVEVQAEVQQTGVTLNVVEVADPQTALKVLEQARYASDAHSGRGGDRDEGEVERALPAHAPCVQEADGGGAGADEAAGSADAA